MKLICCQNGFEKVSQIKVKRDREKMNISRFAKSNKNQFNVTELSSFLKQQPIVNPIFKFLESKQ
jgi:hypothetical protein